MSLDDIDSELERLHEASERVGENLLALELDGTHRLLRELTLEGESAAAWDDARNALTELWRQNALLDEHLARATKLRGTRARLRDDQVAGLEQLLFAPSLELMLREVPLEERDLLGVAEVAVRCTPGELLALMSSAFDEVKATIALFSASLGPLSSRVHAAAALADRAVRTQRSLGEEATPALERDRRRLGELMRSLAADPLSVRPEEVVAIEESLASSSAELEAAEALRADLSSRLERARRLLDELRSAEAESAAVHREAALKLLDTAAPPPTRSNLDPGDGLARVVELSGAGAWRRAHDALEQWTVSAASLLEAARRSTSENTARLERREELRGRLDAYRAKASALQVAEEPRVRELLVRARDGLYRAPVDLVRADESLRALQQALAQLTTRAELCRS